jgi:DnaJ-class molecular chaperone
MTANIAHLVKCRSCRGTGARPAVISLDGGFTPGTVCTRCNGSGVVVVGSCECDEEHDDT